MLCGKGTPIGGVNELDVYRIRNKNGGHDEQTSHRMKVIIIQVYITCDWRNGDG